MKIDNGAGGSRETSTGKAREGWRVNQLLLRAEAAECLPQRVKKTSNVNADMPRDDKRTAVPVHELSGTFSVK